MSGTHANLLGEQQWIEPNCLNHNKAECFILPVPKILIMQSIDQNLRERKGSYFWVTHSTAAIILIGCLTLLKMMSNIRKRVQKSVTILEIYLFYECQNDDH